MTATWWGIAIVSLVLRSGFPVFAIGDAGLDDALFMRLARNLGTLDWLGPFDNTTLVKGMFYPLFILAAFLVGIPLKLAEQAVYLAAAALVARLVVRGAGAGAGTALFAALAFNPVLWTVELARVMREGLYISLSLAVVGMLVAALFPPASATPARRFGTLLRGLVVGLVAGASWITREEGVWLIPAAFAVLAVCLLHPTCRPAAFLVLPAAALGFALVLGLNIGANRYRYGLAERLEVNSAPFRHAYGALSRIAHERRERYVVFPADARRLAYQVSPAARELQPALDGEIGAGWRYASCGGREGCPEILSSWFQWALRDAVAAAGHYTSLPDAAHYYSRLAHEIDDACDRAAIPCLPPRATLAPPFRWTDVADALHRALHFGPELLRLGGNDVRITSSTGTELQIDIFEDAVGPARRRPDPINRANGWLTLPPGPPGAPGPDLRLGLRAPAGTAARSDIRLEPAGNGRFNFFLSTTCPASACDLVAWTGATELAAIPLDSLTIGTRIEQAGLAVTVEVAGQHVYRRGQFQRTATLLAVARPIGRLYALAAPVLALLGLVGTLLALTRRDLLRSPLFALAAASALAVASRVALIAYLDVTAIPTEGILYLSPAAPFVITLAVTGLALLRQACATVRHWPAEAGLIDGHRPNS